MGRVLYRIFPRGGGGGGGEWHYYHSVRSMPILGGSGGMLLRENFLILQPLRLLLVASETTSQFGLLLHIFTFFMTNLVGIVTH